MNIIDKIKYKILLCTKICLRVTFLVIFRGRPHVCLRRFSNIILCINCIGHAKRTFPEKVDYDFFTCIVM